MVVKKKLKVKWTDKTNASLERQFLIIKDDSPKNAKMVRMEILKATKAIPKHPRKYQIDEHFPQKSGEIRRFFKWSYRIVYEIQEDSIDILNVIHTSREPSIE